MSNIAIRRALPRATASEHCFGQAAIALVSRTYLLVLAIHIGYTALWLYHTQVSVNWADFVYGHLGISKEAASTWDYFHFFYLWLPAFVSFAGFWELIPLSRFYLTRKSLEVDARVHIHRKPFRTALQLAALATAVLAALCAWRFLGYTQGEDQHVVFQLLLLVMWGKWTAATAWYTGWKL